MPAAPKPPCTSGGRAIENGAVSLTGGVSFELRHQDAIDYLATFHEEDVVELVVHGRVKAIANSSQRIKDGTLLTRRVTIEVDYLEGSPNDVAAAALATAQDDAE